MQIESSQILGNEKPGAFRCRPSPCQLRPHADQTPRSHRMGGEAPIGIFIILNQYYSTRCARIVTCSDGGSKPRTTSSCSFPVVAFPIFVGRVRRWKIVIVRPQIACAVSQRPDFLPSIIDRQTTLVDEFAGGPPERMKATSPMCNHSCIILRSLVCV